jgi:cytochrome P450
VSEEKLGAQAKVIEYLSRVIDERAENPGDDLLSRIAGWRKNPRFQGEHEVIGMALLVFFGGLDTVANMLSFTTEHLARHPEDRKRLIDDPALIPQATEEFIRRFGLSNTGRLILSDFDYKGAPFKRDEMVMVPISMSSMDDRKYADPLKIDFDRAENFDAKGQPTHNTFGNGPHKCVGSPLARAEMHVFLQEWLKAIPDFRLDPANPPVSHSGAVNGMNTLHLLWDA